MSLFILAQTSVERVSRISRDCRSTAHLFTAKDGSAVLLPEVRPPSLSLESQFGILTELRLSLSHARAHGPAGRGARVVPDLHNVLALARGHDIPVAVHDQVVIRVGATTHAEHGVVGVLTDGREEGGVGVDHDQASFFLVWVAALRSAWATS